MQCLLDIDIQSAIMLYSEFCNKFTLWVVIMAKKIKGKGKKKRIILIFLVIILACIGGVGAYFVKESSAGPAEIEQSEAKFFTTLKESPTDGSTPLDYSAYDNIAFAL